MQDEEVVVYPSPGGSIHVERFPYSMHDKWEVDFYVDTTQDTADDWAHQGTLEFAVKSVEVEITQPVDTLVPKFINI